MTTTQLQAPDLAQTHTKCGRLKHISGCRPVTLILEQRCNTTIQEQKKMTKTCLTSSAGLLVYKSAKWYPLESIVNCCY